MKEPLALFRTDATVSGGLGHLIRCLALAQGWQSRGGRVVFVTTETPSHLVALLQQSGCEVITYPARQPLTEELSRFIPLLKEEMPLVLFLDGYKFDEEYHRAVMPWTKCLVCIDDVPQKVHLCDVLLNQNLGVTTQDYRNLVGPNTHVLVGPRFALLRKNIRERAGSFKVREQPERVLVTMGGADPHNYTSKILEELVLLEKVTIDVVLGPLFQHTETVERVSTAFPKKVLIHRGLADLVELACEADLAITAGGSTVWELACLGVPMVVLGTADNQSTVLKGLSESQAGIVLGQLDRVKKGKIKGAVQQLFSDLSSLQKCSDAAIRLVDGKGIFRVLNVVDKVSQMDSMVIGSKA